MRVIIYHRMKNTVNSDVLVFFFFVKNKTLEILYRKTKQKQTKNNNIKMPSLSLSLHNEKISRNLQIGTVEARGTLVLTAVCGV